MYYSQWAKHSKKNKVSPISLDDKNETIDYIYIHRQIEISTNIQ